MACGPGLAPDRKVGLGGGAPTCQVIADAGKSAARGCSPKEPIDLGAGPGANQLGALVREQTGIEPAHRVLKYDGRPFSRNEVVEGVERALSERQPEVMVSHA